MLDGRSAVAVGVTFLAIHKKLPPSCSHNPYNIFKELAEEDAEDEKVLRTERRHSGI